MKKQKIFIVHGWTYSTEKWDGLVEWLNKHGVDVVMLKVPGLTAPLKEVWELENYVEWLRDELTKEKGKVILLGHSNGGRIGLAYTVKYPEKVKQLILMDSAGIFHNDFKIRIKRLIFGNLAKAGRKFTDSVFLRKVLYKFTRESDYERANPVLRMTLRNLIRIDLTERLSEIKTPTVIIWGEDDRITPLRDGKIMNVRIKGSELFVIKGAKHSPHFTNMEEVGNIILKQLN